MEKELLVKEDFSKEQVELIKSTIAKESTDEELRLFLYQSKRTGLDPLAGQIHFLKFTNKATGKATVSFITSIDGYRLIASRTGGYAGNDDYTFDNNETQYQVIERGVKHPKTSTSTVYRTINNERVPFTATATWDSYYPGEWKGKMWLKFPFLMLGKCAEALALRKAFPQELGNVYTAEEMDQATPPEGAENVQKITMQTPTTELLKELPKPKADQVLYAQIWAKIMASKDIDELAIQAKRIVENEHLLDAEMIEKLTKAGTKKKKELQDITTNKVT